MSGLFTTTNDSDARFVKADGDPRAAGYQLVRQWEEIHPTSADGLWTTLNGVKEYVNPKADNQTYTGTFVHSRLDPVATDEDNIYIRQALTLTRSTTPENTADFVSAEADPQFDGYALTRQWKYILPSATDTLVYALKGTDTYTDPQADNDSHPGLYINTSVTPINNDDRTITIRQKLTKCKSATDSSDADLVNMEGDPTVAGSKLKRAWYYIHPVKSDGLYTTLNGISSYSSGINANKQNYTGRWVVSRVRQIEEQDRTITLQQDLTKVKIVASDTTLVNPLIDREVDIVHPFGEGTGTRYGIIHRYINLDPSGDTKFLSIADTKLATKITGSEPGNTDSYIVVSKKTTLNDDRTSTAWVLFRDYTRRTWVDSDAQSPDLTTTRNKGRDHEVKEEDWIGFDRSDHATALANLEGSTDTGYALLTVRHEDTDDDAKNYRRMQIKESADSRIDSSIIAPHSPDFVKVETKHTDWWHQGSEPTNPAIDSSFVFVKEETGLDNDGLVQKRHILQKNTASNSVDTKHLPDNHQIRGWTRPHGSSDIDSVGKEKVLVYDRVPIANAPSATISLASDTNGSAVDTQHITQHARYTDLGDGSAKITRRMVKVNTAGNYYVRFQQNLLGRRDGMVRREWPKVWDTYADVLMDTSHDTKAQAVVNFSYGGTTYQHGQVFRIRHFDRTSTVVQTGVVPNSNFSTYFGLKGGDIDPYKIEWQYINNDANGAIQGHVRITTALKETTDSGTAYTHANASDYDMYGKMGIVQYVGTATNGVYQAYKKTLIQA